MQKIGFRVSNDLSSGSALIPSMANRSKSLGRENLDFWPENARDQRRASKVLQLEHFEGCSFKIGHRKAVISW